MGDISLEIDALDQTATVDNASFENVLACLTEALTLQEKGRQSAGHEAWRRHIWVVVQKIIPKWSFSLSSHRQELDRTLLFLPTVSLPVLLENLQSNVSINVLEIYAGQLKRLLSARYFESYAADSPFFNSALCSIPARLANAFGLQTSEEEWFLDRNFYATLAQQVVDHVITVYSHIKEIEPINRKGAIEKQTLFVSGLLGKMFRQGQEAISIKVIYPAAAAQCRHDEVLAEIWTTVWERVEKIATIEKLAKATLFFLHDATYPISTTALDTARFLFYSRTALDAKRSDRIKEFLSIALFDLSKSRWVDARVARISIATAAYAAGLEPLEINIDHDLTDNMWRLADTASNIFMEFLRRTIDTWTDPVFIRHAGYQQRLYTTKAMLVLVAYADKTMIQNLVNETSLMSGITRWFQTSDAASAKLGVVVAESISSLIDDNESILDCGVLDPHIDSELIEMKKLVSTADAFKKVEEKSPIAVNISGVEIDEKNDDEEIELDPDALINLDTDTDSEDQESDESDLEPYAMEDESDTEETTAQPKKQRPKRPVYILDLIAYLKDHEDPTKLEIGLSAAEGVIRQKTNVGSEISDYAIVLSKRLIGLPEDYDLVDMRERQQGALTALIVACPRPVAQFIIDQIYDRNMSVSQKQMLLSSIAMSVRELAGWTSETQQKGKQIDSTEEMRKMLEAATLDESNMKVGKTRVFSRKLEVMEKQRSTISRNRLSGLAGPVFFFPLLVGWWEGAQGRIKLWIGRDPLLAERFVMTLTMIMHCATNIPDKRRIVMEYFEFALSMRYVDCSQGVKRALLLGIGVVLNTCYQGQEALLMDNFATELAKVKIWLEDIMENNNEDELKHLTIMLLSRLMNISTLTPEVAY